MAVEAVEDSEVAEAIEVNEAAEVFWGLENHYWGLQSHPGSWIQYSEN